MQFDFAHKIEQLPCGCIVSRYPSGECTVQFCTAAPRNLALQDRPR